MIICSHCQQTNRQDSFFCKHCGRPLVCPRCREILSEPDNFCDNCGQALADAQEISPLNLIARAKDSQRSLSEPGAGRSPEEAPQAPSQSLLEQFVPSELRAKLETASREGGLARERRVVTMLFCDIQGSTRMAARLDPEEWAEIINGAFEYMIQPVYRYEGTVARLMGDGILAFFGAPVSHEDDPQRAILAGLQILSGIQQYNAQNQVRYSVELEVRVGINTGNVVVGAVGSDLRMEYSAVGDAINLAARMEQTADPGTLRIAGPTYRLVAPLFEVENLGRVAVKGREEPVQAYRVLGARSAPGRLRGIEGLEAPLIGRQDEWAQLTSAVGSLRKGVGGIVILAGEAGLGKSRLIRELQRSLDEEESPVSWYETVSLSYEAGQPYHLFQRLIRRLVGVQSSAPPKTGREKLAVLLTNLPDEDREQARRVFESLLGIPDRDGLPPLDGESFRAQLYICTSALLARLAEYRPLILAFDDLHWADPASIGLLAHILNLSEASQVLFLCALRPDRSSPGWQLKHITAEQFPHRVVELQIRPLSDEDSNRLIDSLLTISDLPEALRSNIMTRAEGNPFFVEEVIRTLIDSGDVVRDSTGTHWSASRDGAEIKIPENLQALLITRIDRLDEETREVLQLASLIGRSFYYRVLAKVIDDLAASGNGRTGEGEKKLDGHLSVLQHADLIREAARVPELEYMFRHALTQEATYRTILHKIRRRYHRMVGEVIEELFGNQLEEQAVALAFHFQEAGDDPRASLYNTMAGDAAFRLYALDQAIEHYEQALSLIDLPAAEAETLIHIHLRKGRALELQDKFELALETYAALERLAAERQDDSLKLASLQSQAVIFGTFTTLYDPPRGVQLAEDALALARRLGDHAAEARVQWCIMCAHGYGKWDLSTAVEYGAESLKLARRYNFEDQLPFILNDLGRLLVLHGELKEGQPLIEDAIRRFRLAGNLPLLQDSLSGKALLNSFTGDLGSAFHIIDEGLRLSRSINNQWGIQANLWHRSMFQLDSGELGPALETLEGLLAADDSTLDQIQIWPYLSWIYSELGTQNGLLSRYGPLLEHASRGGPWFESIFQAQLMRIYLALGDLEAADAILDELELDPENDKIVPLILWPFLGYAERCLAQGEVQNTIRVCERVLKNGKETGLVLYAGDFYLVLARAQLAMNPEHTNMAKETLAAGERWAKEKGHRRILWQLQAAYAELVSPEEAAVLRAEAAGIVHEIAAGIMRPELRRSFLARPEMAALTDLMPVIDPD